MMVQEADSEAIVEIKGLTKVFRDFWRRPKVKAVDGLDLSVKKGEIFGLLGPNGSGKSTTIKMALGLLRPTSGRIRVLNQSPEDVDTKKRIGYLPEESYLYKYLTPRETLDFYGRLFSLDRASRRERTRQLLEMTGLSHAAGRSVGEFSKGMARRVGLAQALLNDPELIILDEPTSGLDPMGCRQVKDLMKTLAGRGKTIILSSHLLADVEDVCDRIAILFDGRIRAQGRVNQLLEERDSLTLTMPSLPPELLKRVLSLVREKIGREPEVEHPKMDLEQFFLGVVAEAHKDAVGHSGVPGGEGIAGYLTNE
jgi:ABC-2 type transport system ATP-binding protein